MRSKRPQGVITALRTRRRPSRPPARRSIVLTFLAIGAVGVVAASAASGLSAAAAATPQTLVVDNSSTSIGLDPGVSVTNTDNLVFRATYDSLLTFAPGGATPIPDLATSYKANANGTVFTFHLNPKAVFSDGTPVTASDVVWSLLRTQNLKQSAAVVVAGLSATAVNAHTVKITSATPNFDVPYIVTGLWIVNSKLASAHGATDAANAAQTDTASSWYNTESAGSGAYTLVSWAPTSEIVLQANPKYWGKKPYFSRIVIQDQTETTQLLSIKSATSDTIVTDVSGSLLDGLPSRLKVSSKDVNATYLYLNANPAVSSVTSNPKFVEAVRLALNYSGAAALFGKTTAPGDGLVPPGFQGGLNGKKDPPPDFAKAKKLLAQAGLTNSTVTMDYPAVTLAGIDFAALAAYVQADLAKAGITLTLNPQTVSVTLAGLPAGKNPISLEPAEFNYPSANEIIRAWAPGTPYAGFAAWTAADAQAADPALAPAAAKALSTSNPAKHTAAVEAWTAQVNKVYPIIGVLSNAGATVSTPDLVGAEFTPSKYLLNLGDVSRRT
jgi:peptide/nickel transport system substrate-binding protein